MSVRERLLIQEPVFYGDDLVVKVVPKWDKHLKVIGGGGGGTKKNIYPLVGNI
jgi:hypothetical protein